MSNKFINKIIVVVGPTAAKKSKTAIELAKKYNAEIISADVFQMYKEITVGTNKLDNTEMDGIVHHFHDFISIESEMDISIFQTLCDKKIDEIWSRGKNVIICGGSHLYIDAVVKGYDLQKAQGRNEIVNSIDFNKFSTTELYDWLLSKDEKEAIKIGPNNWKRLIRACQIIDFTGNKKSEQDNQHISYKYDVITVFCNRDRQVLHNQINLRVDQMLDNGWNAEVNNLLSTFPNFRSLNAAKAIGYSEIVTSIDDNTEIPVEKIKQKTRQLARRQISWCNNKFSNVINYDIDNNSIDQLIVSINERINND